MRVYLPAIALALLLFGSACSEESRSTPSPTTTPNAEAQADALCPNADERVHRTCVSNYVAFADSSRVSALCVNELGGTWYFRTPETTTQVGDECPEEPSHVVVALIGGEH